jgi:hypothetical protein
VGCADQAVAGLVVKNEGKDCGPQVELGQNQKWAAENFFQIFKQDFEFKKSSVQIFSNWILTEVILG